jgi:hypothetical protein
MITPQLKFQKILLPSVAAGWSLFICGGMRTLPSVCSGSGGAGSLAGCIISCWQQTPAVTLCFRPGPGVYRQASAACRQGFLDHPGEVRIIQHSHAAEQ